MASKTKQSQTRSPQPQKPPNDNDDNKYNENNSGTASGSGDGNGHNPRFKKILNSDANAAKIGRGSTNSTKKTDANHVTATKSRNSPITNNDNDDNGVKTSDIDTIDNDKEKEADQGRKASLSHSGRQHVYKQKKRT